MIGLFIFIHSVCAILLIVVILMQSGRGGGLTETFASAESMFGAKTNEVMVKATVILAVIFLVSSLALAHLSSKREKSLLTAVGQVPTKSLLPVTQPAQTDSPKVNIPTNKL